LFEEFAKRASCFVGLFEKLDSTSLHFKVCDFVSLDVSLFEWHSTFGKIPRRALELLKEEKRGKKNRWHSEQKKIFIPFSCLFRKLTRFFFLFPPFWTVLGVYWQGTGTQGRVQ
jgi:hypothetical protein